MGKHIKKKFGMRWLVSIAAIIALFIGGSISLASTASAMEAVEQVCGPLDSGKIDTTGDRAMVTVTAPEGFLISGYCVKAASAKKGNGPESVTLDAPVASITFGHSSGKAVSHYSVSYVEIVIEEPPVSVGGFIAPSADNVCGLEYDVLTVPGDTEDVRYNITSDTRIDGGVGTVVIDVVAQPGKVIADGEQTVFEFYFDNQPCITVIEVQPQGPTFEDYCGTANDTTIIPADTDQLDYSEAVLGDDGFTRVTVSAKTPYALDGKLQTTFEYAFTDESCGDEEPPVVITPPAGEVTGTDDCDEAYTISLPTGVTYITLDGSFVNEDDQVVNWKVSYIDGENYSFYESSIVDGDVTNVRVSLQADYGYSIAEGVTTEWNFVFTNEECPVVVPPTEPPVVVPPVEPPVVVPPTEPPTKVTPPTTPPVSVPVTDPKTENVLYDAKTDGATYASEEGNSLGVLTPGLLLLTFALVAIMLAARKSQSGVNRS